MNKRAKIYVAGHRGLVGSAILRKLQKLGYSNFVLRTHKELDLLDAKAVSRLFRIEKPEYVFMAAARVGGIMANRLHQAEFIHENLIIQENIIHSAYMNNIKKLVFLGSSCVYPKLSRQPIKESYLFNGPLEENVMPYAVAKIAGLVSCQAYNRQYGTNFVSVMPSNVYGPGDNFDPENSHVLAALLRRFHEAKINDLSEVLIWGSGKARREFIHVDDLADAIVFVMNYYDGSEIINVGVGEDISIKKLAEFIKKITRFKGKIVWDKSKPDGAPRKLFDVSRLRKLGWRSRISFESGLRQTYDWYKKNLKK